MSKKTQLKHPHRRDIYAEAALAIGAIIALVLTAPWSKAADAPKTAKTAAAPCAICPELQAFEARVRAIPSSEKAPADTVQRKQLEVQEAAVLRDAGIRIAGFIKSGKANDADYAGIAGFFAHVTERDPANIALRWVYDEGGESVAKAFTQIEAKLPLLVKDKKITSAQSSLLLDSLQAVRTDAEGDEG